MTKHTAILAAVLVSSAGLASAEPLAEWSWNNVTTATTPMQASTHSAFASVSALNLNDVHPTLFLNGGLNDSAYLCLDGFDDTYNYSLLRTTLSSVKDTVGFDLTTAAGTTGAIQSLSFSFERPSPASAPTSVQAALFWTDSSGHVQSATSGLQTLSNGSYWTDIDLAFGTTTAPIPVGPSFGGQNFHVELYATGGTGPIFFDDLTLNGSAAAVIPEPTSVILLASAGLTVLLRRRQGMR